MKPTDYFPEKYWDAVAEQISQRGASSFVAGDNDPYYVYKRKKFLRMLQSLPFKGKKILETGCGPGGNLIEVWQLEPQKLAGADISASMLSLCKNNLAGLPVQLEKTDGKTLPFEQSAFDIVFTSTVLQHITDTNELKKLIESMCRVADSDIYLFERIEKKRKSLPSNRGRTVKEYEYLFRLHSFDLEAIKYLHVHWSRIICGMIRKVFNSSERKEGEPQTRLSVFLQKLVLPVTKRIDDWVPVKNDVAMLHFKKT